MAISIQKFSVLSKRSALTAVCKCPGLWFLLLLFVLVGGFVDPVREIMTGDDGWAYALSVRHLLATGEYRLNNWATANMPTQIYLGALLTHVFGYSFTVLRFSTVALLFVGLIALYHLLRDFNVEDAEASVLTLAVFASPLVLYLGFTFQTDVQFLAWQVLALWLYARALRKESYPVMALASMVAFAAIGTRQFGAASVAALFATWLLFEQHRLRKAPLYLVGLTLPLLMTLWQISFGLRQPTFSEKVRLAEESAYLRDLPSLAAEVLWRPIIILQYLGLFLLPLAPLLVVLVRNCLDPRDRNSRHGVGEGSRFLAQVHGCWLLGLPISPQESAADTFSAGPI
jgi:4-amino-4-deoxy-L-arabinose transferase-like glycosyltransferase